MNTLAIDPEVSSIDLHRAYSAHRDSRVRDELMRRHQRFAMAIAARFCNHSHDREDRAQVAMVGLFNAIERYDPHRNVAFSTFAWATITGELKRFHRSTSWGPHVPRSLQELHLKIARAIEVLTNELGRSPTIDEIAALTDETPDAVVEGIELNRAKSLQSLDLSAGDDGTSVDVAILDGNLARVDDRVRVEELLQVLPARSREIVRLRFAEELSQSQIATRVGLSQMHVSRLLGQALDAMREAGAGAAGATPSP